jgi:hypothetical protein
MVACNTYNMFDQTRAHWQPCFDDTVPILGVDLPNASAQARESENPKATSAGTIDDRMLGTHTIYTTSLCGLAQSTTTKTRYTFWSRWFRRTKGLLTLLMCNTWLGVDALTMFSTTIFYLKESLVSNYTQVLFENAHSSMTKTLRKLLSRIQLIQLRFS